MSRTRGADDTAVTDQPHPPGGDRSPETPRARGADGHDAPGDGTGPRRQRVALTVAGITAVIATPIVVAVVAVRTPQWYPLVDLAQIEMRVRDVGTSHPPLVGLGGRIFGLDSQGAHPGPVSFWLLAPVYRLLGSTSWALQVSAATLNVAALAATVWAGHRRWGLQGALLVGAALALVMRVYGTAILVYPWNPYTPVLFWMLFLVCVWGVLGGDLPLLPVAVLAGTVCAQTHLPYVPLVGVLVLLVIAGLVVAHRRARGDVAARRRLVRWSAAGAALGAVLWLPVVVQQIGGDPPNISVIIDAFGDPAEDPVGIATAWRLLTEHLDVALLVRGDGGVEGSASSLLGVGVLVAWAAAAAVAVRRGDRTLVTLHVVVAAALVAGLVSISRIHGVTWFYLTLWAYGTAVLALVAVVATAAGTGADRTGWPAGDRGHRVRLVALALAVLVPTALLTRSAPATEDADAEASARLAQVIQPTVDAIDRGEVAGGPEGTLFVTWDDTGNLGGQGIGLMLELERRGYRVRAQDEMRVNVRPHRVASPDDSDGAIHLASGDQAIERAAAQPGARQIASVDTRTGEDIARYERLRDRVVTALEARGLDDLVPLVDHNLFGLGNDERLPADLGEPVAAMGNLPQPVAVYTWELTP
ncbi:MAG TPA: hypothetical protein VFZ79_16290 [Acidimicrobiales bacterium]